MVERRKMVGMFRDIGLEWSLDKQCAVINVMRGNVVPTENLPVNKKNTI